LSQKKIVTKNNTVVTTNSLFLIDLINEICRVYFLLVTNLVWFFMNLKNKI